MMTFPRESTQARTCTAPRPGGRTRIGRGHPFAVIAGPCVLESPDIAREVAGTLADACDALGISYIFKASFDKANRTSPGSPRGPGIEQGLQQLADIRAEFSIPVTTDVHLPEQADEVAEVVDVLQIPAFLSRQTDLLVACAEAAVAHDGAVNIKKGQFLSPREMLGPVAKVQGAGCSNIILTERGTFFGYHRLVNDFVGLGDLMELEAPGGSPPVCFDCTHSTQLPGASETTGGRRDRVELLARAAAAAGVHAVFIECHPDPERAPSDASTMLPLSEVPPLLRILNDIAAACRSG